MAQSNVVLRQEMADSTVRIREDVGKYLSQLSLLQGELDQFRRFMQYTRSLRTPDVEYERIEPGDPEQRIAFMRHLAAYRHAYQRVRTGYRVLDLGCGEGYGAYLLSGRAAEVVGYDISAETIAGATEKYSRFAGHLSFKTYDGAHVPEDDRSCDLVTCFQVIEHVRDPESFLGEVKRILKPQGVLVISTPNRLTFSPDGKVHIHHVREFSPEEFRSLLEMQFAVSEFLGLHCGLVVTLREDVGGTEYGRRGEKIRDTVRSLPADIQQNVWNILLEASALFSVDLADTGHFFLHDQNLDEAVDLISLCHPKTG
jgi:2-polyprenyl-3-methyl-5-hydroxy-6-metoxy-1,4-benzoquinol methylase